MDAMQRRLAAVCSLFLGVTAAQADSKVTVGSPLDGYPRNAQNEPAVAYDPTDPLVLVAGANEFGDTAPCDASPCNPTRGVGSAGIYFSFDGGETWIQPEYTGYSARTGTPIEGGPIGTLPRYFENGLVAAGDPGVAFGPRRGADGFSWANGSRLYYSHLTGNSPGSTTFRGQLAIGVSYTDDVVLAAEGFADAWSDPIIVTRQNSALLSDKPLVWADNAASSLYFGNVYVCNTAFRGNGPGTNPPLALMLARSTDGGDTWTNRQIGSASDTLRPDGVAEDDAPHDGAGKSGGRHACVVRTDSLGVVYLFWIGVLDGKRVHMLARSYDGGESFERGRAIAEFVTCGKNDSVSGVQTFDGLGGTRAATLQGVDIANGVPTGADATDQIVFTWCDAAGGVNHETALFITSLDGGETWSAPIDLAAANERPIYPAVAISPEGSDVYVTYNAFFLPWQSDTSSTRLMQGVVRHATVANGAVGAWSDLHRGVPGDARGSSRQLNREFIYDYNAIVATANGAVALWIDARNAVSCPAVNAYRQSLSTDHPLPPPLPAGDCPASFGNLDVYAGAFADPTP
jgi:hypothetical protein